MRPGQQILLGERTAEIISKNLIGHLPYLRVYIEEEGLKTICQDHMEMELIPDDWEVLKNSSLEDLNPTHPLVNEKRFNLRIQAEKLRIAHEQGQLLSPSNSLVRLEPYQLACVNEVMGKLRQRVLIADDVGLGKTIEAGLIFKELKARRRVHRALIIVPAHLQKKWIRDMDRFFSLQLTMADRTWVEAEKRRWGEMVNIWNQEGLYLITSMAFLRQEEFQRSLDDSFWDLAIVDECHKAARRGSSVSKTSQLVEMVSHNSDTLLLLSATPHDGREESFCSLISYIDPFLQAPGEVLTTEDVKKVMIRRGKEKIFDENGNRVFTGREVKTIAVRMSDEETAFYQAVTTYIREIYVKSKTLNKPIIGFVMALVQKRLVSSLGAIRETLRRRLKGLLLKKGDTISSNTKTYLDGEDLDEEDQIRAEKELEQVLLTQDDYELEEEIRILRSLIKQSDAISIDTKTNSIRDFLYSLMEKEPDTKVLLFTEYRDTLDYLYQFFSQEAWGHEILIIHGDVNKEDRFRIEEEFNKGRSRILLATDAASEGIDLQQSCHIVINVELPWNPNRLEQRIGRIHRYGQKKEVKVWNFQYEGTREKEIFELLQDKMERIRLSVGSTADVLGLLESLNITNHIMQSLQDHKPPSATKEELKMMIEKREETLKEWYSKSLVGFSGFDKESQDQVKKIINASKDAFCSPIQFRTFVEEAIKLFDGEVKPRGSGLYEVKLPHIFTDKLEAPEFKKLVTFNRDRAIEQEEIIYLAPDSSLVNSLINLILDRKGDFGGKIGLKVITFLEKPGITFVYRIAFEDGKGDIIQEEIVPLYVDGVAFDPNRFIGEKVIEAHSFNATPDYNQLYDLVKNRFVLQTGAEKYVARYIERVHKKIQDKREKEMISELRYLKRYEYHEAKRLETFIQSYQEELEKGREMDISIRKQEYRLLQLKERIENRRRNVQDKTQVVALAPDLVGLCFSLPFN